MRSAIELHANANGGHCRIRTGVGGVAIRSLASRASDLGVPIRLVSKAPGGPHQRGPSSTPASHGASPRARMYWSSRQESNLHDRGHQPLRLACLPFHHGKMVWEEGFEPPTTRSQTECSTAELLPDEERRRKHLPVGQGAIPLDPLNLYDKLNAQMRQRLAKSYHRGANPTVS